VNDCPKITALAAKISQLDAMQMKLIANSVGELTAVERTELDGLIGYFQSMGLGLDRLAAAYMEVVEDYREGMLFYAKNNRYRNATFADVDASVYHGEYMENYMIGLCLAKHLDYMHRCTERFYRNNVGKLLQDGPGGRPATCRYLEVGCGHGLSFCWNLANLDLNSGLAVDLSAKSVEMTRALMSAKRPDGAGYEIRQQDFFDLAATDSFQLIVMGEVLEHVERPLDFLQKGCSLLDAGGVLFITVPMNCPVIDHIYLFRELDDILELVARAGLAVAAMAETPVQEQYSVQSCHKRRLPTMAAMFLRRSN